VVFFIKKSQTGTEESVFSLGHYVKDARPPRMPDPSAPLFLFIISGHCFTNDTVVFPIHDYEQPSPGIINKVFLILTP